MSQKLISEEEIFKEIQRKVDKLRQAEDSKQFALRTEIEKLAEKSNLLYFETNIYYQYRSHRQAGEFLEALEETGIIMVDKPLEIDELFILPPGSKIVSKTSRVVDPIKRRPMEKRSRRETIKIQLPNGKVIRFIDYSYGPKKFVTDYSHGHSSWGHLIL